MRRWSFATGRPLIQSGTAKRYEGFFFIPSIDGKLYVHDPLEGVEALPITIQEIVNDSPFVSSDGTIYVGKKKAAMFALHVSSGRLDGVYPSSGVPFAIDSETLVVGRADFKIEAMDPRSGAQMWNMSFSEFISARPQGEREEKMLEEEDDQLESLLESTTDGTLLMKGGGGSVQWSTRLSAPVTGIYRILFDKHKQHFEMREVDDRRIKSVYIGEYASQLYVLDKERLISPPLNPDHNMLPSPPDDANEYGIIVSPPSVGFEPAHPLIGYHNVSKNNSVSSQNGSSSLPMPPDNSTPGNPAEPSEPLQPLKTEPNYLFPLILVSFLLVFFVIVTAVYLLKLRPALEVPAPLKKPIQRNLSEDMLIGNLRVTPTILGYGSGGTIVYLGYLQDRKVAVKRMLSQFWDVANKEISMFLDADEHPHLVSYYAKEVDSEFIYLALSYCESTLDSVLTGEKKRELSLQQKTTMVRELVSGLSHLHSIDIVHRDLKPANVFLFPFSFHLWNSFHLR